MTAPPPDSNLSTTEDSGGASKPPGRSTRWKLLRALALCLLPLMVLFALLASPPAENLVSNFVRGAAARRGIDLGLERLDLRPLRLSLEAQGLAIEPSETASATWSASAHRAEISWSPFAGFRLNVERPKLLLDATGSGAADPDSESTFLLPDTTGWVPALFELPEIDLRDGRVEILVPKPAGDDEPGTTLRLVGEGLELALGRTDLRNEPGVNGVVEVAVWRLLEGDERRADLGATRLSWVRPTNATALLRGAILGADAPEPWQQILVEAEVDRATAAVVSRWTASRTVEELRQLLDAFGLPHPRPAAGGRLTAEIDLSWRGTAADASFELDTEDIVLVDRRQREQPVDLVASGTWSRAGLELELFELAALGGRVSIDGLLPNNLLTASQTAAAASPGRVDEEEEPGDLQVQIANLQVAELLDSLAAVTSPVDSRVDGTLSVSWQRLETAADDPPVDSWFGRLARQLGGSGEIRFSEPIAPVQAIGTARSNAPVLTGTLRLADESDAQSLAVRLDGTSLQTAGVEVDLVGTARVNSLDLDYRASVDSLAQQEQLSSWLRTLQIPVDFDGNVEARGLIRGRPLDPRVTARLGGRPRIDGAHYRLNGEVLFDRGELFSNGVALLPELGPRGGLRLTVDGSLPLQERAAPWNIQWILDGLELARWAPPALQQRLPKGTLRLTGDISGPWNEHLLRLRLATEDLSTAARRPAFVDLEAQLLGPGWRDWTILPTTMRFGDGHLEAALSPSVDGLSITLDGTALPIELLAPQLEKWIDSASFDLSGQTVVGGDWSLGPTQLRVGVPAFDLAGIAQRGVEMDLRGGGERWDARLRRRPSATTAAELLQLEIIGRVFETNVDLTQLDAATILRAFVPSDSTLTLKALSGNARAAGRLDDLTSNAPAIAIEGRLDDLLLQRLDPAGRPIQLTTSGAVVGGSLAALTFDGIRLSSPLAELQLSGVLPLLGAEDETPPLSVSLRGTAPLPLIGELLPDATVEGTADVALEVRGSLAQPRLVGQIEVAGASGQVAGIAWRDTDILVELPANGDGRISGDGALLEGRLHFEGVVDGTSGLPHPRSLDFRAGGVDLATLVELPQRPWRLVISASGSLLWSNDSWTPTGRGTLRLDDLTLGQYQTAGLFDPAAWRLRSGRVSSDPLTVFGNALEGEVRFAAELPDGRRESDGPALSARVDGRVSLGFLSVLGQLDPSFAVLQGPADVGVDLAWRPPTDAGVADGGLLMNGTAEPLDAEFVLNQPLVRLTEVGGGISFDGRSVRLDRLRGTSGAGSVEVDGTFGLDALLALDQADLRIYADRLPLSPIAGLDGLAWSQLTVRSTPTDDETDPGAPSRFQVRGRTLYRRARYSANLASGSPEAETLAQIRWEETGKQIDLLERFDLELRISSEDLLVDNELAQIAVDARLDITGTAARPLIGGTVETSAPGEAYLGERTYEVDQIAVLLDDYPNQPAFVRARSTTEAGGERVQVRLDGPTDDMKMDLYAPDNPTLSQADLAALLVTGRSANAATEGVTELAVAQAASYLGDLVASQTGVDLGLFFGANTSIPILSSETDPESRFTVGRSLTDELSIAYSVGLEQAEDRLWILDWRPLRNLWLRAIEENANTYIAELASQSQFDLRGNATRSRKTRSRIGTVVFEGPAPADLGLDRWTETRLERGRRIRINELRAEGERIRNQLVRAGWLAAEVDVEPLQVTRSQNGGEPAADPLDALTEPFDAASAERIDVQVTVRPGRRYAIEWRGDDIGQAERLWVLDHWTQGGAIEPRLANLGRDLRHRLQAAGWFAARVQTSFVTPPGLRVRNPKPDPDQPTLLVFDVALGPTSPPPEVRFVGNELLSNEQLLTELPPADDPKRYALFDDERSQLRQRLALRYAAVGVLELEIERITGLVGQLGSAAQGSSAVAAAREPITVYLREGAPSRLIGIEFPGASFLSSEQLGAACGLTLDQPIDLIEYGASRSGVLRAYREAGLWQTRVRSQLRRIEPESPETPEAEAGVVAVFQIEEGYRARVASIRWSGDTVTRQSVLAAQLDFEVDGQLTSEAVFETQRRLYNLGLFRSVEVLPVPRPDSKKALAGGHGVQERGVDVTITIYDKPNLILDYGLRYRARANESASRSSRSASNEGFELAFRTRLLQPFEAGGVASVSFFPQQDRDVARLRYDRPLFFGYPVTSSVFVEARQDRRPEFDLQFDSQTLTLQLERELWARRRRADPGRPRFQLQWGVQAQWSRVVPGDEAVPIPDLTYNETFLRTQLNLNLVIDDRDALVDPRGGSLWSASLQGGTPALGSDFDFVRFYGEGAVYRSVPGARQWVWASGVKLGTIESNDAFPFLEDRFTAGGAYSVRGFDVRDLGPQINGEPIGGRALAVLHQELRFPIRGLLRGGLFVDSGTVFSDSADFDFDDFRTSAGLGLRATLPFGVLRLDWARVVDGPAEDLGRERFHIAFGHAF